MHKKPPPKGLNPMDRRIPKNEKYSRVQGVLDTGLTVNKVKAVTAREYARRRDEIFFRITKQQLYELYNEYEGDEERIQHAGNDGRPSNDPRIVTYSEDDSPCYEKPYLLLDVREPDLFQQCHLLHARSYPYTALRRDYVHPEVYAYKNKAEHLIICYCEDERMSKDAAKLMVDRGMDNIFLLTGGLNEFGIDFPIFIEGDLPAAARARASAASSSSSRRSSSGIATGRLTGNNSGRLNRIGEDEEYSTTTPREGGLTMSKLAHHNRNYDGNGTNGNGNGMLTGRRTQHGNGTIGNGNGVGIAGRSSEVGSTMSRQSVAESVISRATARKGKF